MGTKKFAICAAAALVLLAAPGLAGAEPGGAQWRSAGGDLQNTRSQASEHKIGVDTVGALAKQWEFTTGGDVSATPAVDGDAVYFPDWAGNLYAVDRRTGRQIW